MRYAWMLMCLLVLFANGVGSAAESADRPDHGAASENVARGRPYTLVPRPDYGLCTDPGDRTQLTDGQYTHGYFWTQKSTVGWNHAHQVVITLDLGEDVPIRGLSFNTAAGVAGVQWPASILVLLSVDGRVYHDLGDLVTQARKRAAPPAGKYAVHRFQTDQLRAHGRYVKLIVDAAGAYCFVDEIEVFRGADAWKKGPLPGRAIRQPMEYFADTILNASVKRRIGRDLETARAAVLGAALPAGTQARMMQEVAAIEQAIAKLPEVDPRTFKAVFPLNSVHARVYAFQGAVRAAQGKPALVAWGAVPWDFLKPTELPALVPKPRIAVAAMRGESRAGAVNLTNCTARPTTVRLRFDGLSGGATPDWVTVREVAWTDTHEGTAVAAALPEVAPRDGVYPINVPAGMTRQVWFTFTPRGLEAGRQQGELVITGAAIDASRVPISVRVFDLDFPAEPALHVGGWDYTDGDSGYGITAANRSALIAHLRARYVDSPWATRAVMPYGAFDKNGDYQTKPDTARFDRWLTRWPAARRYCVFAAVGNQIAGTPIGQPLFEKKVGQWIRFWVEHAGQKGVRADQLVVLLVDEPHDNSQDRTIIAWARAVNASAPDIVLWEDPTYRVPTQAMAEMMAAVDVLCPNRPMMLAAGKPFVDFYRKQRARGRRLDLYSCSGPSRLLDPYAYYRLQAWSCFELGAESTFFWAFGDTGDGNSWNEYASRRTSYTPLFLGPDSVTAGKHMEAIRESVADFEYLTMLRRRVAELHGVRPEPSPLAHARALLAQAAERVLNAKDATMLSWRSAKDRTVADQVRVEIGQVLEDLKHVR